MKLTRLSLLSITGCLLLLVLLLLVAAKSLEQMQVKHAEIRELIAIKGRTDAFSAGSDALLINPSGPVLWEAFLAEAESLQ